MNALILSLLSAFCVGSADFLSRLASRKYHPIVTVFSVMVIGCLLYTPLFLLNNHSIPSDHTIIATIFLCGNLNLLGLMCLYISLKMGPVSLASPIAALSPLLTALMWIPIGIVPSEIGWLGIGLSGLGGIMISLGDNPKNFIDSFKTHYQTVIFAFIAALLLALRLIIIQNMTDSVPPITIMLFMRISGLITLMISMLIFIKKIPIKRQFFQQKGSFILFIQAIFENSGILLLLEASQGIYKIYAPMIFSSFTVITITLAVIFLKERISLYRLFCILLVLLGILLLNIG